MSVYNLVYSQQLLALELLPWAEPTLFCPTINLRFSWPFEILSSLLLPDMIQIWFECIAQKVMGWKLVLR